jgi:hypothetical protein
MRAQAGVARLLQEAWEAHICGSGVRKFSAHWQQDFEIPFRKFPPLCDIPERFCKLRFKDRRGPVRLNRRQLAVSVTPCQGVHKFGRFAG